MSLQEIWEKFLSNVYQTGWKEWVSTITQIASVWYARKNNVLVYPTGIIGVLLAAWLYFFDSHPPLYADGTLNIYYFIMSLYGWYNWIQKKDAEHLTYPISWCSKKELPLGILLFLTSWGIIYFALVKVTNSNTPILDSLVSASAVVAMWWMAKRKIENWLGWIISNIVAIPLNFYKEFYLFTLMYVLFLIMAMWGFIEWKRKYAIESTKDEPKVETEPGTNAPPFVVNFYFPKEIRMGSPFNVCTKVELVGTDKIKLPEYSWQDKCSWSPDKKILAMVFWDIGYNNVPAFHFYIINAESGKTFESERIVGCVSILMVLKNKIYYDNFKFDKNAFDSGKQDFMTKQEYILPKEIL